MFKLDTAGKETVLRIFDGANGAYPFGAVVLDDHGNIYGTTQAGGGGCACGTIFELNAKGGETVLYKFTGIEGDGQFPQAGLVRDAKGNLFGTTYSGGGSGLGTVTKLSPNGKETVLHDFSGAPRGALPEAVLVLDPEGNLFGTTLQGGPSNDGVVFEVTRSGTGKRLASFSGSNGAYLTASLVRDKKGNFYGTASEGGDVTCNPPYGCGVVFKLTPK